MEAPRGWPPPRRKTRVFLAVAGSILASEDTLQLKTLKAAQIGRAAGSFRVDRVIVYPDGERSRGDARLLRLLLEYYSTPPYLRRRLFTLAGKLRYAGLMPPLQTPSHVVPPRVKPGMYVEGIVVDSAGEGSTVFIGERAPRARVGVRLKPGRRVIIKIVKEKEDILEGVVRDPPFYWRFTVDYEPSLESLLDKWRGRMLLVAASRLGEPLIEDQIGLSAMRRGGLLLAFGGPRGHVWGDRSPQDLFDLVYNALPFQGNKTLRTEEAVQIALARLDRYLS